MIFYVGKCSIERILHEAKCHRATHSSMGEEM